MLKNFDYRNAQYSVLCFEPNRPCIGSFAPEVRLRFTAAGFSIAANAPESFDKCVRRHDEFIGNIANDAGIKPEQPNGGWKPRSFSR
jgi:hypothetical protein